MPALIAGCRFALKIMIEAIGSVHNVRQLRYVCDMHLRFNRGRMLMQPVHT